MIKKNNYKINSSPIRPEIECDGWYTYCPVCETEIEPDSNCHICGQKLDWSWFHEDLKTIGKKKNKDKV